MQPLSHHIKSRRLDVNKYSAVWLSQRTMTFTVGLWNLSGQLVGFQQYKPNAGKERPDNPRDARYYTYATRPHKEAELLAFGVELLDPSKPVLFIVEGMFDAVHLHNMGQNCIATLSNNPKHLRSWLGSLGYYIVALCEGDAAGKRLASSADEAVYLPDGKDPADMSIEWYIDLITKYP